MSFLKPWNFEKILSDSYSLKNFWFFGSFGFPKFQYLSGMFSFRFGTYSFRCGMNSYRSGIHSFRCNFSHSVPDKHDWPRSCPGRRCGRSGSRGAAAARAAPRSGWSCPPGSPPLRVEKISDACEIKVIIRYYGDQGWGWEWRLSRYSASYVSPWNAFHFITTRTVRTYGWWVKNTFRWTFELNHFLEMLNRYYRYRHTDDNQRIMKNMRIIRNWTFHFNILLLCSFWWYWIIDIECWIFKSLERSSWKLTNVIASRCPCGFVWKSLKLATKTRNDKNQLSSKWIEYQNTEDEDRGYRGGRGHTLATVMETEVQPPVYKADCKSMTSK